MSVSWLYYKPNFTQFPLLLRILQPVLILTTMSILPHLALSAKLGQNNLLRVMRWMKWHCPPDTGFEIRALADLGRARYLSVTGAPHNIESLRVSGDFLLLLPDPWRGRNILFLWNLKARVGLESAICLSVCLPACLSVCLSVCLSFSDIVNWLVHIVTKYCE